MGKCIHSKNSVTNTDIIMFITTTTQKSTPTFFVREDTKAFEPSKKPCGQLSRHGVNYARIFANDHEKGGIYNA